jgi:hypothetical protein
MNKRTLIAGFIVLAIAIALGVAGDQIAASSLNHNISHTLSEFAVTSIILAYIIGLAGIILIIYGAILPDPPVHWDNNL